MNSLHKIKVVERMGGKKRSELRLDGKTKKNKNKNMIKYNPIIIKS